MSILLLNSGSSSLKATLMDPAGEEVLASGMTDWARAGTHYQFEAQGHACRSETVAWTGHSAAVARFIDDLLRVEPATIAHRSALTAVAHRIVHGGAFTQSVRITPEIRARIAALAELAPLHNPPSLESLRAAEEALPGVPQVAVFDTTFHATLPPEAWTYPLPRDWTRQWGIRRFGFHGLSHAYCSRRAAEMLERSSSELRLVICHLGNGCSAAAVRGGRCLDTTMGFTPLDGLMMGTRCGSLDPSIVVHVQQRHGLTAEQVETALNHESGLLGVSGLSADMRAVQEAADAGDKAAQLAISIFVHRARQAIGALTVTLGGIDALVFTAGIGEHAGAIRQAICRGLECLGLELSPLANENCRIDADIAHRGSRGRILVIKTREDLTMLRETRQVLGLD
ncbi:MAG TPA: acetate/propionate family kinase [Pirellulales bacterium]|jgi:acetate kinase|nr:acetate/propionate family kinase [Pirellulales bacterium]